MTRKRIRELKKILPIRYQAEVLKEMQEVCNLAMKGLKEDKLWMQCKACDENRRAVTYCKYCDQKVCRTCAKYPCKNSFGQ